MLDAVVTVVDARHVTQHLDEEKPDGVVNEAGGWNPGSAAEAWVSQAASHKILWGTACSNRRRRSCGVKQMPSQQAVHSSRDGGGGTHKGEEEREVKAGT